MNDNFQQQQELFTKRLNDACDAKGIPVRGRAGNLQKILPFRISIVGIRKWLVGESIPDTKKLADIATSLGVSVESLIGSSAQTTDQVIESKFGKQLADKLSHKSIPNADQLDSENLKAIPILSEIQASDWARVIIDEDVEFEWLTISAQTLDQAFAMRITGNSMTNPFGFPSLPAGSIIVVEPNNSPENGKIVVATLNDSPQATVKKLEIDGPHKFLVPLNPKYDPIPIDENCRIIGFVKQVIMNL